MRFQRAPRAGDSRVVAAIVLAAGRSLRFGGSKLLADLGVNSVLQATLDAVRESVVRDIVLVLGHQAKELTSSIDPAGIEFVYNPGFDQGMSASIKAGVEALKEDVSGVLFVLGDQPLVCPQTIDCLVEAYRTADYLAVVPSYLGRWGNPGLLDLSLRPEMERLEGDVGCKAILEGLDDVEVVEVDDPGILIDVDTSEDLDRVLGGPATEELHG